MVLLKLVLALQKHPKTLLDCQFTSACLEPCPYHAFGSMRFVTIVLLLTYIASQLTPNLSHRNHRALDFLGLVEVAEVCSIGCKV